MSRKASEDIGYAGYGLMCGIVASEFCCAANEYHNGNMAEAAKYATLGSWFSLPLLFDGLMRLGGYRRKSRLSRH